MVDEGEGAEGTGLVGEGDIVPIEEEMGCEDGEGPEVGEGDNGEVVEGAEVFVEGLTVVDEEVDVDAKGLGETVGMGVGLEFGELGTGLEGQVLVQF